MKVIKYSLIFSEILLVFISSFLIVTMAGGAVLRAALLVLTLSFGILNACSYWYFRMRFVRFADDICRHAEQVLHGVSQKKLHNRELLSSKLVMELEKMEHAMAFQLAESRKEKKELQEMISEITHQIKTPVSNIKMYCEMLPDEEDAGWQEQSAQFLTVIRQQLDRLEFLLDALLKSSRLESDMIKLECSENRIIETIAAAVTNVMQKAGRKKIDISAECDSSVRAYHDMKWTAEAIENILDNAVKYTPEYGNIRISVRQGEMYTAVHIRDNGKGIEAAHVNDIFKRFYREKSVSKTEGLGLGLYLARNIIAMQKGYITVHSAPGQGSCFSVFLLNRMYRF